MRRLFPVLALIAGSLLAASFATGMIDAPATHGRLGIAAAAATLGVHGLVTSSLWATGRRIESTADRLGMPDWVGAQAEKNRRRAAIYPAWGVPMVILAVGTGPPTRAGGAWHLALSGAALTFQVGAFVGEFVVIAAQARLARDVEGWAAEARPAGGPGI